MAILFLFGLLLVACTTSVPAADPAPVADAAPATAATGTVTSTEPTAVSSPSTPTTVATTSIEPAASAEPTMMVEPTEPPATVTSESAGAVVSGRTADGTFFLGAPDAPITLIDYSDFL